MAFKDDLLAVLSGGLPALIETPVQGAKGAADGTPSTAVEQTSPQPQLQDSEPFLMRVTQNQILGATALALGFLGIIYFARKA